jgi:hypothetical protein
MSSLSASQKDKPLGSEAWFNPEDVTTEKVRDMPLHT